MGIKQFLGLKPKKENNLTKKKNNLKDLNFPMHYYDLPISQSTRNRLQHGPNTMIDTSTRGQELPESTAEKPYHTYAFLTSRSHPSKNVYAFPMNNSTIRKRASQKSPKGGKSRRRKHRKTVKKGYFW
jgi:hypothetical protein